MDLKNIVAFVAVIAFLLFGGLGGCALYNTARVWNAEQAGKAELAQAVSNRQISTVEAKAKLESAKLLADAEVIRAEGAARANRILQNSLGGPEGYLRYLQIQAIDAKDASVIYVPTEGGLPITESRRMASPPAASE